MRMIPFLAITLLLMLSINPEVTSQPDCEIVSNGCSVPFDLDFFYKDDFYKACYKHDICYSCVRFSINICHFVTRKVVLRPHRLKRIERH